MEAILKLYPDYINDVLKKKHMKPEIKEKKNDDDNDDEGRNNESSDNDDVDDYKPPDTLNEDDARKDGNLNMRLKLVHIDNIKSRLKPEKNMGAADLIHLFYLNPTSRFGFKEVVQDIIADKIYYRPTTTFCSRRHQERETAKPTSTFSTVKFS
jgi:hypothetical protein